MTTANPLVPLPLLQGPHLRLRPLRPGDFEALYEAASDPLIWEQHPDPLRWQRATFKENFFAGALSCGCAYVIEELQTGSVMGSSRFYDWDAGKQEVAIGFTFLRREYWGGIYNAELKKLMLELAFRYARRVWFHIGVDNLRSRKAVEKIGAHLSYIQDDTSGDGKRTAYYAIDRPNA